MAEQKHILLKNEIKYFSRRLLTMESMLSAARALGVGVKDHQPAIDASA
jgi:hypothetical protein